MRVENAEPEGKNECLSVGLIEKVTACPSDETATMVIRSPHAAVRGLRSAALFAENRWNWMSDIVFLLEFRSLKSSD